MLRLVVLLPNRYRRVRLVVALLGVITLLPIMRSNAQVINPDPGFHPRYKELFRVNGTILDADENSVLYSTLLYWPEYRLYEYHLKSRSHHLVTTNVVERGQLIPGGVVVQLSSTNGNGAIIQFSEGEEIDLGVGQIPAEYNGNHVVNGRYGILHLGDGTVLRDFIARTNYLLPVGMRARYLDLAENGNVIFTTRVSDTNTFTNTVYVYKDGQLNTIDMGTIGYPPHVQTDGSSFIWSDLSADQTFGVIYLQSPGELEVIQTDMAYLNDLPPSIAQPNLFTKPTAMNGGWVAFEQRIPNTPFFVAWRRSPEGNVSQTTTFPSYIKALRSDGGLLVTSSGIWFIPPDGEPRFISPEFYANCFFVGDQLYAYTQTHFYQVDIEGAPFALTSPSLNATNGVFSYNIHATESGNYSLERSNDLVNWTTLESHTITNLFPVSFDVPTAPGFFRLKRE